jgi:hypothetical protein
LRLASDDGVAVDLSPLRYEFGSASAPRDWDANWLVIAANVSLPDGRSWSFNDPCLTTWEARELGSWLRDILSGNVQPSALASDGDERLLAFTEPNLAFSLVGRNDETVTVRVYFSLESSPPWVQGSDDADLFDFFVEVWPTHQALRDAVASWERELAAFPER